MRLTSDLEILAAPPSGAIRGVDLADRHDVDVGLHPTAKSAGSMRRRRPIMKGKNEPRRSFGDRQLKVAGLVVGRQARLPLRWLVPAESPGGAHLSVGCSLFYNHSVGRQRAGLQPGRT